MKDIGMKGRSQNRNVNVKGKTGISTKAPVDTRYGKSTAGDATNVIAGTKVTSKALAPNSWPQSRNRGKSYK